MDATRLSKTMGLSYQAVKRVLDGKSAAFTAPNNAWAARALNVSGDWLATGEGSPTRLGGAWPFSVDRADYEKLRDEDRLALDKTLTGFIAGTLVRYENEKLRHEGASISKSDHPLPEAKVKSLEEVIKAAEAARRKATDGAPKQVKGRRNGSN